MRAKFGLLLAGLLTGALTAATAQTIPCAAVAPEVRDRVRADGACSDSAIESPQPSAEPKARPGAPARGAVKASTRRSPQPKAVRDTRPETLPVPSVVGATIESAQAQLQGFQVERFHLPSPAPAGEVVEQSPDASASAAVGSRVLLVISSGPPMVQLPNVVDRSYDDATAALSAFTTIRIEVPGAAPSGQVLAQEPASGSMVAAGSRVALQVSDGSLAGAAAAPLVAVSTPPPVAVSAPVARAPDDLPSLVFSRSTLLAIVASLLLGAALGALAMRQWLVLHPLQAARVAPVLADEPAATVLLDSPPAEPAPPVRFFARLDAGEIAVEFPRLVDDEEPVIELASDR